MEWYEIEPGWEKITVSKDYNKPIYKKDMGHVYMLLIEGIDRNPFRAELYRKTTDDKGECIAGFSFYALNPNDIEAIAKSAPVILLEELIRTRMQLVSQAYNPLQDIKNSKRNTGWYKPLTSSDTWVMNFHAGRLEARPEKDPSTDKQYWVWTLHQSNGNPLAGRTEETTLEETLNSISQAAWTAYQKQTCAWIETIEKPVPYLAMPFGSIPLAEAKEQVISLLAKKKTRLEFRMQNFLLEKGCIAYTAERNHTVAILKDVSATVEFLQELEQMEKTWNKKNT